MKKLKVVDLFAGIGGFTHGFGKTGGFETVAFVEWDSDCQKVLQKHWPQVQMFNDVTRVFAHKNKSGKCFVMEDATEFISRRGGKSLHVNIDERSIDSEIDVLAGGFPCQDISSAGGQKGLVDEELVEKLVGEGMSRELAEEKARTRSGLWFEYKRLIKEIRPKYVVIENVRNLLSNGFAVVLKDLSDLGYDVEWEVISARSVGAPHLRERLWIVAYPSNSNDIRLWPTFTSEEEKSEWWSETTSEFRTGWKTEPEISGVDDGLSGQLEKLRVRGVKQLGNSIVPGIAMILAKLILGREKKIESRDIL